MNFRRSPRDGTRPQFRDRKRTGQKPWWLRSWTRYTQFILMHSRTRSNEPAKQRCLSSFFFFPPLPPFPTQPSLPSNRSSREKQFHPSFRALLSRILWTLFSRARKIPRRKKMGKGPRTGSPRISPLSHPRNEIFSVYLFALEFR